MRLMASIAGEPTGMIRRGYLRKALWLGGVGLVTAGTHDGCVQFLGLYRTRIVCVLGQGPVAGLASDNHMLAKFFLVHDLSVATLAGVVPGKRDRPGRDLTDCRASIVAILPKTVRHYSGSQYHECH